MRNLALNLVLCIGVVVCVALLRPEGAQAVYNQSTFHYSNQFTGTDGTLQTYNLFTVPSGIDLTLTDIVVSYQPPTLSSWPAGPGTGGGTWSAHARVYESGQTPNPTNYNSSGTIEDRFLWTVHIGQSDYGDLDRDPETGLWEIVWMPGYANTEGLDFEPNTLAHHFQTGLVFVSGNSVNLDVKGYTPPITVMQSTFFVTLSGLLQ